MKKKAATILLLTLSVTITFSQNISLKEKALEKFQAEHYDEAINLLEQALERTVDDPEIYYYLGKFNHYRASNSRPLKGYDYAYSERILEYLSKALELNPNYGDAKYFYGVECGVNADIAKKNYNAEKYKYFYELAAKKGAYPDWLIEFGKNFLLNCDENTILFAAGDAELDICTYLQLFQNYRTDVTVIPIGYIDRPWYVSFLKRGLEGCTRKVNIALTEDQIMEIRPFKWKERNVYIDISTTDKLKFELPDNYKMEWSVIPDLQSERMHSNIEGNETKRTLLSSQRAILLQIVEDNFSERPICFSNFAESSFYGGLNEYFQNCGLIFKLTPIKTKDTDFQIEKEKIEQLLTVENLTNYRDIKENDIPRVSGVVIYGYVRSFLNLANNYRTLGKENELKLLVELYKNQILIDFDAEYEQGILERLKQ